MYGAVLDDIPVTVGYSIVLFHFIPRKERTFAKKLEGRAQPPSPEITREPLSGVTPLTFTPCQGMVRRSYNVPYKNS